MATREAANRDTWGASLANVCAVSKSDANGGIVIIRASINFKTGIRVDNYERNVADQHLGKHTRDGSHQFQTSQNIYAYNQSFRDVTRYVRPFFFPGM